MGASRAEEIRQLARSALAPTIRRLVEMQPDPILEGVEEIRLRVGRPLMLGTGAGDLMIDGAGRSGEVLPDPHVVSPEEISATLQIISKSSIYAFEEEIRNGFITVTGGHRVGIVGKVVMDGPRVRTMRNISGLCFRVSRQLRNVADEVLKYVVHDGRILSVLVVSPPRAGKTTILRDMARQVSDGRSDLGIRGRRVVIVDERSELAGCADGIAQHDVGLRTDVLDGCPKATGVMMAIRSMGPDVIVTDEVGRPEDVYALREATNCGVSVFASAHALEMEDLFRRPSLRSMVEEAIFRRIVVLSRRCGPGTLERVLDGPELKPLFEWPSQGCES